MALPLTTYVIRPVSNGSPPSKAVGATESTYAIVAYEDKLGTDTATSTHSDPLHIFIGLAIV